MLKPTIGVTCDIQLRTPHRYERLEVYRAYTNAVARAGGLPLILPVTEDPGHIDEQLDVVDGLVLVGGDDYDPKLYGAAPHPKTKLLHPSRQFYDIELARAAIRRKVPTLAICGGHQLVNIVCGGDLIQHLPDAPEAEMAHRQADRAATHDVTVEPDTALARILRTLRLTVNSSHHQAVGRVGGGLRVTARSPDGVIEALESKSDAFLVCVQWHPERLAARSAEHLALFAALVEAALNEDEAA